MPDEPENLMLGAYRVLRKEDGSHWVLGRGGYGTTYKAEHIHLERICALKVINENLVRDERAAQRFLQEARIAASLDHPNIARIYDFGRCDGVFYYAMNFCSGGDLDNYSASRGPQPWSVVKDLALQILGALGTAHGKGLLHRDLKPSNVMLASDDGSVDLRLIDFGLVKALDEDASSMNLAQTREGTFMGSPLTASPEQFRVETLDERSDLYSLGVTLWCLLIGGAPFNGVSVAEIAHQRLSVEGHFRQLPANLDPEARYILRKLLATKKENRFRNVEETRAAILGGDTGPVEVGRDDPHAMEDEPVDWEGVCEIGARLRHFHYGSYYSCTGMSLSSAHATLFVPDQESPVLEDVKSEARKLLGSQDRILVDFTMEGVMGDTACFLCAPFPSGNFQHLLQAAGALNLQANLSFFQQIATSIDEAIARGIPGIELEDHEIMLGVGSDTPHPPVTTEDWVDYFKTADRLASGPTTGLRVMVLPKLIVSADVDAAPMATITGDDLAPNPVRRFAGFLYRAFSGRIVNPGAYLSTSAYVTTSNISEKSNRYLKEVMAGGEVPESALTLLRQLATWENGNWSTKQLEHDLEIKVSTYPSQADAGGVPISGPRSAAKLWENQAATAETRMIEPKGVACIPIPLVRETPVAAQTLVKKDGKKWKLIAAISVAVLVIVGVSVKLLSGGGDKAIGNEPSPPGKGSLRFPDLTLGSTPPPGSLQLVDQSGAVLGSFSFNGKTGGVEGFPLEVFDEPGRWPLAIKLKAEEKSFIMPKADLKLTQFGEEGGEGGVSRSLKGALSLGIRAYFELEPVVTLDGATLDIPASAYSNELRPTKTGLRWGLTTNGKNLGIALPEGESFPVAATLSLSPANQLKLSLGPGGETRWNLEIPRRKLRLVGMAPFTSLAYEPDLGVVPDEALRKALADTMERFSINSRDFNLAGKQWELPKVGGALVVDPVNGAGGTRIEIGSATSIKVFFDGTDREPDEPESVVKKREEAERGDVDSQVALAIGYFETNAFGRSFEWFRFAATEGKGDPRAQVGVGTAYLTGKGVPTNDVEAVKWFEMAISNGEDSGKAHNNLGFCYERGTGVALDLTKAKENYEKAVEQGHLPAMVSLGILLTDDKSPVADLARGVQLFEDAMKLKVVSAIRELGYCYWTGIGALDIDKSRAKELWKEAAAKGDATAEQMLKDAGG